MPKQLKYKDIIERLKKLGFQLYSKRGKGSHEVRYNTTTGKQTVVPFHSGKDISIVVIKGICNHISINLKDFYDL